MTDTSPFSIPTSMDEASTLLEMLAFRAQATPQTEACLFEDEAITFEELWQEINQVAGYLIKKGLQPTDRVMLIFPNGLEFFSAFYGVMRAGAIAAPIFPASGPERILWIIQHSGARFVIVPSLTPDDILEMYRQAAAMLSVEVCRFDDLLKFNSIEQTTYPSVDPEDVAFLQYTSGSTGNPKGVQLSHRNLMANIRQMIPSAPLTETDVFVSWLPVYHDLGLILMTMCPFYLAAKLVLLPTSLRNMTAWIKAMSEHQATFTAAPDLGYRLALKQIHNPDDYDLSHLKIAINAAEPVRLQTVQDFEAHFNIQTVVMPAYGLAEACVGISAWLPFNGPVRVAANGFISVGRPFQDVELGIINQEGVLQPPGEIGELVFCSPSSTRGYYKNPETTANLFWQDGFIHTGDMAFLDQEGFLYIVARQKNIIKHGGRSFAPIEIEELADSVSQVRYSAAIGVDRGDETGEQIYIFAEAPVEVADAPQVIRAIVKSVHHGLGIRPGRVYLTKPKALPFTYNGKIQHAKLKEDYLTGSLAEQILYPTY